MEENLNKYYTPDITEFYVGFEYEFSYDKKEYKKQIYDGSQVLKSKSYFDDHGCEYKSIEDELKYINVKYLDKEDIESLGWKQSEKASCQYFKGVYTLIKMNDNKITIRYISDGGTLFRGTIKNKSELIKLLKQLNLNI